MSKDCDLPKFMACKIQEIQSIIKSGLSGNGCHFMAMESFPANRDGGHDKVAHVLSQNMMTGM